MPKPKTTICNLGIGLREQRTHNLPEPLALRSRKFGSVHKEKEEEQEQEEEEDEK